MPGCFGQDFSFGTSFAFSVGNTSRFSRYDHLAEKMEGNVLRRTPWPNMIRTLTDVEAGALAAALRVCDAPEKKRQVPGDALSLGPRAQVEEI